MTDDKKEIDNKARIREVARLTDDRRADDKLAEGQSIADNKTTSCESVVVGEAETSRDEVKGSIPPQCDKTVDESETRNTRTRGRQQTRQMTRQLTSGKQPNQKKGTPRPRTGSQSCTRNTLLCQPARPASASRVHSMKRATNSREPNVSIRTYFTRDNTTTMKTVASKDREDEKNIRGDDRVEGARGEGVGEGGRECKKVKMDTNMKGNTSKSMKGKDAKKDKSQTGPVLRPRK